MTHHVQENNMINDQLLVRNHEGQKRVESHIQIAERKKKTCQPRVLYLVKLFFNN